MKGKASNPPPSPTRDQAVFLLIQGPENFGIQLLRAGKTKQVHAFRRKEGAPMPRQSQIQENFCSEPRFLAPGDGDGEMEREMRCQPFTEEPQDILQPFLNEAGFGSGSAFVKPISAQE